MGSFGYYGFVWCGDPRIAIFPEGRNFAPRGLRDCPRAKPKGNIEGRGVQNSCMREISKLKRYMLFFCGWFFQDKPTKCLKCLPIRFFSEKSTCIELEKRRITSWSYFYHTLAYFLRGSPHQNKSTSPQCLWLRRRLNSWFAADVPPRPKHVPCGAQHALRTIPDSVLICYVPSHPIHSVSW